MKRWSFTEQTWQHCALCSYRPFKWFFSLLKSVTIFHSHFCKRSVQLSPKCKVSKYLVQLIQTTAKTSRMKQSLLSVLARLCAKVLYHASKHSRKRDCKRNVQERKTCANKIRNSGTYIERLFLSDLWSAIFSCLLSWDGEKENDTVLVIKVRSDLFCASSSRILKKKTCNTLIPVNTFVSYSKFSTMLQNCGCSSVN